MEGHQLRSEGTSGKMIRGGVENANRISNLPALVLNLILSLLPIRDAVRTSILSKSWRHEWTKVPVLKFNAFNSPLSRRSMGAIKTEALVSIIDHVLLHHTGDLEYFKLEDLPAIADIDRWIIHVSRNSIKKLVLRVRGPVEYELPPSLYGCSSLINLKLGDCFLKPPPHSVRLQNLKCLSLINVDSRRNELANFISSCPYLESLTLGYYAIFADLHMKRAPNLQSFEISGQVEKMIFSCPMVKLSEVTINYSLEIPYEKDEPQLYAPGPSMYCEYDLSTFFINLPCIRRLKIASYFVKHLARDSIPVPVSMPFQLKNLYHLAISIDFRDTEYCLAALYIMNGSPNLKELQIDSKAWDVNLELDSNPDKWREGCEWRGKFEKLRSVEIVNINGWRPELDVIEFLLGNSPVLQWMTIVPYRSLEMGSAFLIAMLSFKRASSDAAIIFHPRD